MYLGIEYEICQIEIRKTHLRNLGKIRLFTKYNASRRTNKYDLYLQAMHMQAYKEKTKFPNDRGSHKFRIAHNDRLNGKMQKKLKITSHCWFLSMSEEERLKLTKFLFPYNFKATIFEKQPCSLFASLSKYSSSRDRVFSSERCQRKQVVNCSPYWKLQCGMREA